jgi:hypothetical protein
MPAVLCRAADAVYSGRAAVTPGAMTEFPHPVKLDSNPLAYYGSVMCFWAGILCALASSYYFLIASIEDVVLAIVLFGCAVGLEVVAVVLKRKPPG